jgi:FkbM family methyltransferase
MGKFTNFLVSANRIYGKKLGWQIRRYQSDFATARKHLIQLESPTLAIDGGANEGQWAREFRIEYPDIPIVSFEPVIDPFHKALGMGLEKHRVENFALGSEESILKINVASNGGMSSSIGKPTGHLEAFPSVTFGTSQEIRCVALDSFEEFKGERVWLKLDLQGYEWKALNGAKELLEHTVGIEIETSLSENYEGEKLNFEIVDFLNDFGFRPFHVFAPGISDTGEMRYLDVLFSRNGIH